MRPSCSAWPSVTRPATMSAWRRWPMRQTGLIRTRSNRRRRSNLVAVSNLFGLSAQAKARLIEKLSSAAAARAAPAPTGWPGPDGGGAARLDVAELEASGDIRVIAETADF